MKSEILDEKKFNKVIEKIYVEEQSKFFQDIWDSISDQEKEFVIESVKILYPQKSKMLNESKWYNLVGDLLGIVDPTGIIDILNGISYWRQGEKLFAILSWVAAVPILGDLIAKPVMFLFKTGNKSAKAFKTAFEAKNISQMSTIASKEPALNKFVKSTSKWGPKVVEWITKIVRYIPIFGKSMSKTLSELITLLGRVGKETELGKSLVVTGTAGQIGKALSETEKLAILNSLKDSKVFSGYQAFKPTRWDEIKAGVPKIWGNRNLRSLFGRTMWYYGLLRHLGFNDNPTPDELEERVPDLDKKIEDYSKTQEAEENWNTEFANLKDKLDLDSDILGTGIKSISSDPVMSLLSSLV